MTPFKWITSELGLCIKCLSSAFTICRWAPVLIMLCGFVLLLFFCCVSLGSVDWLSFLGRPLITYTRCCSLFFLVRCYCSLTQWSIWGIEFCDFSQVILFWDCMPNAVRSVLLSMRIRNRTICFVMRKTLVFWCLWFSHLLVIWRLGEWVILTDGS